MKTWITLTTAFIILFAAQGVAQVGNTGRQYDPSTAGQHVLTAPEASRTGESILYAPSQDDDPVFRAAVAAITGGPVDYFDSRVATPDAGLLNSYDCVYTWADFAFLDNVAFGDNLADFVDVGGSVILGGFSTYTSGNSMSGRIMTAGYCPVISPTGDNHFTDSDYAGDGVTQIHDGVTAYASVYRDILALQGAGMQDGSYLDSEIAHAYRPDFKVIYSNGNGAAQYPSSGDWPILVANACQSGRLSTTVHFPVVSDTWQVANDPYWYMLGDTVFGQRNTSVTPVNHADVALRLATNVLQTGAYVDLHFRINGISVGTLQVTPDDGVGIVWDSFDFGPMVPPFELRYYETNTVPGGGGSISLNRDPGNTGFVTFTSDGSTTFIFFDGFESGDTTAWN